ncbi:hypothetical protein MMC25_007177 [Agyrium rufum]|nr:hypothetical protein [Agyrium rufum]
MSDTNLTPTMGPVPKIRIEGPRVVIRSEEVSDAEAMVYLFNNEANLVYSPGPPTDRTFKKDPLTPAKQAQKIADHNKKQAEEGIQAFCLVELPSLAVDSPLAKFDRGKSKVIGCSGINRIAVEDNQKIVNIGVLIDASEWRKGYGSEALKLVVDYAINKLGADLVEMDTDYANRPMRELITRDYGDFEEVRGGGNEMVIYVRFSKDDWKNKQLVAAA